MPVIQSIDLITTDPNIRGGRPCISGTGIRVTDIVMTHLFHQRTPDAISSDYDLSLAKQEPTRFGTRYVIDGTLHTPSQRTPQVRVVWFIPKSDQTPRLATAYPLEESNDQGT